MRTRVLTTAVVLLLSSTAAPTYAQQVPKSSGAVLRVSTKSAEARAAFYSGVEAAENQLPKQAEMYLARALELDPGLGIARAYYAAFAPTLTSEQRQSELQHAAADAMDASVGELLMVLALRAPPGDERRSLLKAAVEAAPDDAHVLYQFAVNTRDAIERIRLVESLTRRHPDFAPAYNLLAYGKARELGDLNAGLTLVQRYVQLTPDNPNAHDSYAEILQLSGRLADARQHYLMAIALNPAFAAAHSGLAEIAVLEGKAAEARRYYQIALRLTAGAQQKLLVRRAAAATYIVDGDVKSALAELGEVANESENIFREVAAQAHRNMAIIEATLGTKTLVDAHIRKAEALSNPNNILQRGYAAAAYALAGDLTAARPLATAVTATVNSGSSPMLKRQTAALNEIVLYASGETEAARAAGSASSGSFGAMGKVLLAEALAHAGRNVEARAIAQEVRNYYETDLVTIIARRRALRF
jgi:tetratricopeptide (TPR) repeat protein